MNSESSSKCGSCRAILGTDTLQLWDGKRYCRTCIANAGHAIRDRLTHCNEFCDTLISSKQLLNRGVRRHWFQFMRIWFMSTATIAIIVYLVRNVSIVDLIVTYALISGFVGVLLRMILTLASYNVATEGNRSVIVGDGQVRVISNRGTECHSLFNCRWTIGQSWTEPYQLLVESYPFVILDVPQRSIAIGRTKLDVEILEQFFSLIRLARRPYWTDARVWYAFAVGAPLGYCVGKLIQIAVDGVRIGQNWKDVLPLVGGVDGLLIGVLYASYVFNGPRRQSFYGPIMGGLLFFLFTVRLFSGAGIATMLLLASVNSLVGISVGYVLRRLEKRPQE